MRIKCHKQTFAKALQSVNAVATQRDLYPILENVRISATDKGFFLKATDLKISLTYLFPREQVEIFEPGELLIPAFKLQSLVKETPDAQVTLEKKDFNGVLTCQDARFCILGEDPAKFPEIPEFQEKSVLEISGEDFQKMIKKTLFATTSEKTRYDLDNVLVNVLGDTIRFVATDGKRLALCDRKCKALGEVANNRFTVPSKGLQQIEKVLNTTNPPLVALSILDNQLLFRTNEFILSTRLSDAKFPPYERVIPKNFTATTSCAIKDFGSALRRVCVLTDEKNKIVEMVFSANKLKIFAVGEGTGEATVEIPAQFSGTPFDIKFNANFLLDMIKVAESSQLEISGLDGQSAVLVKDGEDFQYVVLPIKMEEKVGA